MMGGPNEPHFGEGQTLRAMVRQHKGRRWLLNFNQKIVEYLITSSSSTDTSSPGTTLARGRELRRPRRDVVRESAQEGPDGRPPETALARPQFTRAGFSADSLVSEHSLLSNMGLDIQRNAAARSSSHLHDHNRATNWSNLDRLNQNGPDLRICARSEAVPLGQFVRARIFHTPFLAGAARDQEELSVGTPTSFSTITAVSGIDGEVIGRRFVRTEKTRRWKTSTAWKNYDDHSLAGTAMLFSDIDPGPYRNGRRYLAPMNGYHHRLAVPPS
ncbi:hypothetical protein EVAR_63693_1 [Eumeta japonica]|uniref:Uncharacterized protein n=1 Tax=Eumeta variegata TaxID=151549 RepID=A0A4C1Z7K1_EUMVA|nr:hypothetical protein EVAR_63693_1 [Eumeta japonica]